MWRILALVLSNITQLAAILFDDAVFIAALFACTNLFVLVCSNRSINFIVIAIPHLLLHRLQSSDLLLHPLCVELRIRSHRIIYKHLLQSGKMLHFSKYSHCRYTPCIFSSAVCDIAKGDSSDSAADDAAQDIAHEILGLLPIVVQKHSIFFVLILKI